MKGYKENKIANLIYIKFLFVTWKKKRRPLVVDANLGNQEI